MRQIGIRTIRTLSIVLLSGFLLGSLAGSAVAQTYELKVSHFLPPNHTFQKALIAWGEELDKQSGGRLKLRIYPASQLGPPPRQFDLARTGVADIAVGLHGLTPGRYALTELVSSPYTAPSTGTLSATTGKRLTELAPRYLAKEHEGLHILWMAVTSPLMFISKAPIRAIDDFKGLKVRYAGANWKAIIDTLGGVGLPVPPPETQDALAKGIVEAATFPYEGAASFDLGTVAKYALEPGVSSATFAVVMNQAKYDSLPADLKALIDKTTGPARAEWFGKLWDEAEIAGKHSLQAKGLQSLTMTDVEFAKVKKALAPLTEQEIAKVEKNGQPAKEFYAAYTK
jgi:TRAP-type C4-dicarboxylate transport system substrate-binding protein